MYQQDPAAAAWLGAIGVVDATELPGLDDLHEPEGAIEEAQRLAAECFQADRTFFLVGGSTVGNLAAIGGSAARDEIIIMQRNVHKSAIHAAMLSGSSVVFVAPEYEEKAGLYGGVRAETIAEALQTYPQAKAVFVTSPNYYGMAVRELERIAAHAHDAGVPLIVDEAHGAHFGFHSRFPRSALQLGADAVIQSTHKMLPAMTMGAMLHLQGDRINIERVQRLLRMLQSSSPSYPIMASLDWARWKLHTGQSALFDDSLTVIDQFVKDLESNECYGVRILDDPMKLLLYDRTKKLTGYVLQAELTKQGIYTEMADERYVVLACSCATDKQDLEHLGSALREIHQGHPSEKKENGDIFSNNKYILPPSISPPISLDYFARRSETKRTITVNVEQSAGMVSAEMVIPYPPGIPLLFPGETITQEAADQLARLRDAGASVQGIKDRAVRTIEVVQSP